MKLTFAVPVALRSGYVQVKTPAAVIAFAQLLDEPLPGVVAQFENKETFTKLIYATDSTEPFSLHAVAQEAAIRDLLKERMAPVRAWFESN